MAGTWTVQEVGQDRFALTMTRVGGFPPPSTIVLRVIDNNTLMYETEGYQATRVP